MFAIVALLHHGDYSAVTVTTCDTVNADAIHEAWWSCPYGTGHRGEPISARLLEEMLRDAHTPYVGNVARFSHSWAWFYVVPMAEAIGHVIADDELLDDPARGLETITHALNTLTLPGADYVPGGYPIEYPGDIRESWHYTQLMLCAVVGGVVAADMEAGIRRAFEKTLDRAREARERADTEAASALDALTTRTLYAVANGMTHGEAAKHAGVPRQSVTRWLSREERA